VKFNKVRGSKEAGRASGGALKMTVAKKIRPLVQTGKRMGKLDI